jgi:hypothetical protein
MPLAFLAPSLPFSDPESCQGAEMARRADRSLWAVRFSQFDAWVHEWDSDPGSPNGRADWPRLPRYGRQAVRLYCPNGKFAQLGDTHDASGKLFQLKLAQRSFAVGKGLQGFEHRQALAQVIGMLHGLNGECVLYAWEPLPEPAVPQDAPKAPIEAEWIAKSAEPGLYEQAVQRFEGELEAYYRTPQFRAWAKRLRAWQQNARGRLVGPLQDNVYQLAYQQIGRLSADVLGIDDGEGR